MRNHTWHRFCKECHKKFERKGNDQRLCLECQRKLWLKGMDKIKQNKK
ncbi:MAG: hypothetical protein AABY22_04340 [Nanoarchaeota archaeon]